MKTLTSVHANDMDHDVIIESFAEPDRSLDETHEILWTDKENYIAQCHQKVQSITVCLRNVENPRKMRSVRINTESFRRLYQDIIKIEGQTSEEFID